MTSGTGRDETKARSPEHRAKRMLRLLKNPPSDLFGGVAFRPVQSAHELAQAARLVYLEYTKNRYVMPNPRQMKVIFHQGTMVATTFVAVTREGRVLGTMTLVEDSPLGLPMDKAFKPEVDRLRRSGHPPWEATMLAFEHSLGAGSSLLTRAVQLNLVMNLFKSVYAFVRRFRRVDDLVACFHPKHDAHYEGMEMEPLGSVRSYSTVQDSPAIARFLCVRKQEVETSLLYRDFFEFHRPPPPAEAYREMLRFDLKTYYRFLNVLDAIERNR